jgi:hypothetical protein
MQIRQEQTLQNLLKFMMVDLEIHPSTDIQSFYLMAALTNLMPLSI